MSNFLRISFGFFVLAGFSAVSAQPARVSSLPSRATSGLSNPTSTLPSVIQGKVLALDGTPIANAIVSIVIPGSTTPLVSTRTNGNGLYELPLPNVGASYALRVLCIGYAPATATLPSEGDVGETNVTMSPLAVLARLRAPDVTDIVASKSR